MWLNFLHLFGPEPRDGEPVIETALKQVIEQGNLEWFSGNDQLSADFMLDAVLAAKLDD